MLWQRLITVMNEVDQIIVRTTFSTILSEGRDFACILTDSHARSLCQSSWSTATFTKVYPLTAKVLLERFPVETLREGDVLATNDPGSAPGIYPTTSCCDRSSGAGGSWRSWERSRTCPTLAAIQAEIESADVFSEGLCMPPFKLYEAGVGERARVLGDGANCRVPNLLLGDLRAMAGAAKIGADRIRRRLLDESHDFEFDALAEEILTRSETLMRRRIDELPDGVYEYGLDIDGYIEKAHLQAPSRFAAATSTSTTRARSPQRPDAAINSRLQQHVRDVCLSVQMRARAGNPEQRGALPPDPRQRARGLAPERDLPGAGQGAREDARTTSTR